mgnify:CR=1 FL=1
MIFRIYTQKLSKYFNIYSLLFHLEPLLSINSVIVKKRSAKLNAAVRLKTWNGVLSIILKSNDCSYLQR